MSDLNEILETIKMMVSKSEEKLITAKIDFDNKRYEDSVSRAYYSVYHIISALLLSKGLHFSSHKETIGNFNKEFIKTKIFPVDFSKIIQKLFNERQTSDYDFQVTIDIEDAKENYNNAKSILESAKVYFQNLYKVEFK